MIGSTISHYRISEKLGEGGMGEVFLAEDTKLGRQVALKFLPRSLWHQAEARERLIREAQAASRLDHPNIVTIHGIEEFEGRPFIQMTYVRGLPLNEHCAARPRPVADIVDLAIQMADGLQHAHEAGVVHRDLKPSNILVDDTGRVRILDFGVASLRGAAKLTQTGSTVGTLAYAPPEILHGQPAQPASDIYSLGVVMYQMLTGHLPFEADHEAALLYAILHLEADPLSKHAPQVHPGIQKIIARCMQKKPEQRYADCAALLADLRAAREASARPAAAPVGASGEKPSIAVLPFANMSADPDNEYFSDGLTEELLNMLAKNAGLQVAGRTSSFAFKGRHEDLREIGQKLGVTTLLEGSVRRAGNRVRITAQLVKASDGFHLWSETYDRVLDDIFAVQDDIAASVVGAMNVALLGQATPPTRGDPRTYDLMLQAQHFFAQQTGDSLAKAVALYKEALAKSPEDARAWAGLGIAYASQAAQGYADVAEGYRAAREATDRALGLDPTLADAHVTLGWIAGLFEYRWEEAESAFRKAMELAPGDGRMKAALATRLALDGCFDEALPLSAEAVRLDPLSAQTRLLRARILGWTGQLEAALALYREGLELSPGMLTAHASVGILLARLGRADEGVAEAAKEKTAGYRNWALAMIHHLRGDGRAADEALAELLKEGEEWAFQVAGVYALRGEADHAFLWLERGFFLRDSGTAGVKVTWAFEKLRSDPRYARFLKRVGLEP
jgi:serine/threonine-protein kinase